MTKLFALLYNDEVRLHAGKRVLEPEEYAALLSAEELAEKMRNELLQKESELQEEMEKRSAKAVEEGFAEGLRSWAEQLAQFELATRAIKEQTEKSIVPVAIKAAQKIVGRELEQKPEVSIEIVQQALKAVSQYRRFIISVNPKDLALFEASKPKIKQVLDHAESIAIVPKEEQVVGSCTVETEGGIINVEMEALWTSLESAFQQLLGA